MVKNSHFFSKLVQIHPTISKEYQNGFKWPNQGPNGSIYDKRGKYWPKFIKVAPNLPTMDIMDILLFTNGQYRSQMGQMG